MLPKDTSACGCESWDLTTNLTNGRQLTSTRSCRVETDLKKHPPDINLDSVEVHMQRFTLLDPSCKKLYHIILHIDRALIFTFGIFHLVGCQTVLTLVVIWLCSCDTSLVAAIRRRQRRQYNQHKRQHQTLQHIRHPIYPKHLFRQANCPRKSRSGWGLIPRGIQRVNSDIWPSTIQQVQGSCQNRSVFPL